MFTWHTKFENEKYLSGVYHPQLEKKKKKEPYLLIKEKGLIFLFFINTVILTSSGFYSNSHIFCSIQVDY